MRSEKEIREKLEQVKADLERLNDMYDNDEITKDGFEKSLKTLSAWEYHLQWMLGEV